MIKLEFQGVSAMFQIPYKAERLAKVLRKIADRVEDGYVEGKIREQVGKDEITIGSWQVTEGE